MRAIPSAIVFAALASITTAQAQTGCSPLELVYARATTEPPTGITINSTPEQFTEAANRIWSKGYGAAGYSLFTNLTSLLPGATGYPVAYPANWERNNSAPTGVRVMLERLEKQSKACPNQKFALGGHSQGGGVTAGAIPKIPKEILDKVVAVTIFGGSACPAVVQDRCKSYCHEGDGCMGGGAKGAAGAKGKGAPKLPGGASGVGAPTTPAAVPPAVPAGGTKGPAQPLLRRQGAAAPPAAPAAPQDCAAALQLPEKGLVPIQAKGESAHTVYNKDGRLIRTAACYIVSQYNKASGKKL